MDINLNKLESSILAREMVSNKNNSKQKMLTQDQFNLIKESFDLFDMSKCGNIEIFELKLILKAFNFR